jgi:hypothetical protein
MQRLTVKQFFDELEVCNAWAIHSHEKDFEVGFKDKDGNISRYLTIDPAAIGFVSYTAFMNTLNMMMAHPDAFPEMKRNRGCHELLH